MLENARSPQCKKTSNYKGDSANCKVRSFPVFEGSTIGPHASSSCVPEKINSKEKNFLRVDYLPLHKFKPDLKSFPSWPDLQGKLGETTSFIDEVLDKRKKSPKELHNKSYKMRTTPFSSKSGFCGLCKINYCDRKKHVKEKIHRELVESDETFKIFDVSVARRSDLKQFLRKLSHATRRSTDETSDSS